MELPILKFVKIYQTVKAGSWRQRHTETAWLSHKTKERKLGK